MSLSPITDLIADLKAGRMAVLIDEEDRENEGDLIFAADFVTAEKINFLATHGRGLICMPITAAHAERLNLAPMVAQNRSVHGTNFTVSIEAARGVTTGISANQVDGDRLARPSFSCSSVVRRMSKVPRSVPRTRDEKDDEDEQKVTVASSVP
jgi:3,4-dihydroxy-2-butanone 4-phosphate synthase